jgi:hypothetical protein
MLTLNQVITNNTLNITSGDIFMSTVLRSARKAHYRWPSA